MRVWCLEERVLRRSQTHLQVRCFSRFGVWGVGFGVWGFSFLGKSEIEGKRLRRMVLRRRSHQTHLCHFVSGVSVLWDSEYMGQRETEQEE